MKKITNMKFLKAIRSFPKVFSLIYRTDKKYLWVMLLETLVFSVDQYPELFIMKYTIDALTRHIDFRTYVAALLILISVKLLIHFFRIAVNTSHPLHDQIITERFFNSFFEHYSKLDYQFIEKKETQEKKELAKYLLNGKMAAIGWYFVEMMSSIISILITSILLWGVNPIIMVAIITGTVFRIMLSNHFAKKISEMTQRYQLDSRYLAYLLNIGADFQYAKELRIFNCVKRLKERILSKYSTVEKSFSQVIKKKAEQKQLDTIIDYFTKIIAYLTYGISCINGTVQLSSFTLIVGLIDDFLKSVKAALDSSEKYIAAVAYIDHYNEIVDYKVTDSCVRQPITNGVLELKDVYFRYPNSEKYILSGINLKIYPTDKLSLVGRNGAGKSTLVKLILGLYRPEKGDILLNGKSIYLYQREEYMTFFSAIFQDYKLFAFSIEQNISSLSDAPDRKLLTAVSNQAGIDGFIDKYPEGFGTYVTNAFYNEGVALSGGEMQKLALARLLYKNNALFFILDEPMAAYDPSAEYRLYKQYEAIIQDKAAVLISHRMSSCKLSNRIVLLQDGLILEEGSHEELMQSDTQYRKMFQLQAQQYSQEVIVDGKHI